MMRVTEVAKTDHRERHQEARGDGQEPKSLMIAGVSAVPSQFSPSEVPEGLSG
jgi:hypothetical protein